MLMVEQVELCMMYMFDVGAGAALLHPDETSDYSKKLSKHQ